MQQPGEPMKTEDPEISPRQEQKRLCEMQALSVCKHAPKGRRQG